MPDDENVDSPDSEISGDESDCDGNEVDKSDGSNNERSNEEVTEVVNNKNTNVIDPQLNEFYAIKFETQKDNRVKVYIGNVLSVGKEGVKIRFFRRKEGKLGSYFTYPSIEDHHEVLKSSIIRKMTVADCYFLKHI